jgi:hypothetical protein
MSRIVIVVLLCVGIMGVQACGAADPVQGAAAGPAGAAPAGGQEKDASTPQLVEDLRLLQVLNTAGISADQARRLEPLAVEARAKLDQIAGEERAALDRLAQAIAAARQRLLQGAAADDPVFEQIRQSAATREETRNRRTEALVTALSTRLRGVLGMNQVERVRELMAASAGQSWPPGSLRPLARSAAKRDEDIQRLILDLEALRASAGTPEGERLLQKLLRSLVRDADPQSREHQARLTAAQAIVQRALSLPPGAFEQRKVELAAAADRQLQSALETDRLARAYGSVSDPYRWFVTQVLVSPRATVVLREKGGPAP